MDNEYTMRKVCKAYSIPRTSLKNHYNKKIKDKKMRLQSVFTIEDEDKIMKYMVEMEIIAQSLNTNDVKLKVEIFCQTKNSIQRWNS